MQISIRRSRVKSAAAKSSMEGMDEVDITVEFELSLDVSEQSRYSLANQLAEVIFNALEEKQLEVPDGEIADFAVIYDEEEFMR